mmetsp:Transcript_12709/g.28240  ORF Transcript_12709/g.28240 Transcript_12709/m.28240 type:complete len:213 (-) Transcript_12709:1099-1737(-)
MAVSSSICLSLMALKAFAWPFLEDWLCWSRMSNSGGTSFTCLLFFFFPSLSREKRPTSTFLLATPNTAGRGVSRCPLLGRLLLSWGNCPCILACICACVVCSCSSSCSCACRIAPRSPRSARSSFLSSCFSACASSAFRRVISAYAFDSRSLSSTTVLGLTLSMTLLARSANCSVLSDSVACSSVGATQAMRMVRVLPLSESCRMRVSLESR